MSFPSLYLIESDTLLTDMPKLQFINLPSIVVMEGAIEMNGLPMLEVFGKLFLNLTSLLSLLAITLYQSDIQLLSYFTQTFQCR